MTMSELQNEAQVAVYALAPSPAFAADGALFAATAQGLLRSQDGGVTFVSAYDSLNMPEPLPTAAVAISPAFSTDHTVFAGVAGAVLRTTDRGERWQYASLRTPPPVVTCLVVSPAYEKDGTLFAGSLDDGVFRSGDRGASWASWNFGLIDLGVLCLALSPAYEQDETLLAGTETGLFRSTNGGRAWRETNFPPDAAPVLCLAYSPNYASDGTVYAGTEASGLWVSHDRGKDWAQIHGIEGTVNAIAADKRPVLVLTDAGLYAGANGGAVPLTLPPDLPNPAAALCMTTTADGTTFLGRTDGRVIRASLE